MSSVKIPPSFEKKPVPKIVRELPNFEKACQYAYGDGFFSYGLKDMSVHFDFENHTVTVTKSIKNKEQFSMDEISDDILQKTVELYVKKYISK